MESVGPRVLKKRMGTCDMRLDNAVLNKIKYLGQRSSTYRTYVGCKRRDDSTGKAQLLRNGRGTTRRSEVHGDQCNPTISSSSGACWCLPVPVDKLESIGEQGM